MKILLSKYRIATSSEIRSWSFGAIESQRTNVSGKNYLSNSLDDQAIFGPVVSYQCACGRYTDRDTYFELRGLIICECCGVKYTDSAVRRQRFAHIELYEQVAHPLLGSHRIECFPVLPADFISSNDNAGLAALYERLVASQAQPTREKEKIVNEIVEYIGLAADTARKWKLADRDLLCKGIGLLPLEDGV